MLAKDGSIEDRALRKMDWNNFAPRDRTGVSGDEEHSDPQRLRTRLQLLESDGVGGGARHECAVCHSFLANEQHPERRQRLRGNAFEDCFRPTWQGYPTNLPSNVILYMQRDMPWSYIQNWHFTVQHSLTPNTVVDVAYVGNRGVKLPLLGDLNQARPVTAAELTATGTPPGDTRCPAADSGFRKHHSRGSHGILEL